VARARRAAAGGRSGKKARLGKPEKEERRRRGAGGETYSSPETGATSEKTEKSKNEKYATGNLKTRRPEKVVTDVANKYFGKRVTRRGSGFLWKGKTIKKEEGKGKVVDKERKRPGKDGPAKS